MAVAAIYARVSSDKQREENTIASQTAALIVSNGDGVVADQDLLHHEADDPLPVLDIKRVRRGAQPGQERRDGLGET